MEFLNGELLARFAGVLGVNLILSGDNAVVIALAVLHLQGRVRRRAIFWGATGAVVLRVVFAAFVTILLKVPLLRAAGGLLLVWIAWNFVGSPQGGEEDNVKAGGSLREAVQIIIVADAVMSLDNVIALVGISGGNLPLLSFGLVLTIPLVIWGSTLLSSLLERWRWLVYAGAGLLVWVAAEMFLADSIVEGMIGGMLGIWERPVEILAAIFFVMFAWRERRRREQ